MLCVSYLLLKGGSHIREKHDKNCINLHAIQNYKEEHSVKLNQTPKYLTIILIIAAFSLIVSCAPTTFVKTMSPGWNTVEIRRDLTYDNAWNSIVDVIAKEFDIEILSKEDGYIRTGWYFAWTGNLTDFYRVRAIIKFNPARTLAEVKSEAHYYSKGFLGIGQGWQMGTDERLTTTLRTDIMGKIGRVTR